MIKAKMLMPILTASFLTVAVSISDAQTPAAPPTGSDTLPSAGLAALAP